MNVEEAKMFVARFVTGDYAPGEYAAFLRWQDGASIDELEVIADEHETLQEKWSLPVGGPSAEWIEQMELKLDRADAKKDRAPAKRAVVKRMDSGRRIKWIAAASVVGLLAGGGILWYSHQTGSLFNSTGADSAGSGSSNNPAAALSKSFSIPRGGLQQQFALADGSKVWLNAASTLKYPASFGDKERSVELSGEAYFEIAKKADMPFRIKIRDAKIEVLGTQFNVMAYEDEPVSKTTLVEGAIKVARAGKEATLKPGEQAEIAYPLSGALTPIKLVRGVDQESILAWKNGDLEFKNDELHTVMREIARCYDVEVKYEDNVPDRHFTGNLSRKDDIRQILKQLEFQHIHCRITGKTITVS